MIHTNNPIIKHKAGLLNLAEELGNGIILSDTQIAALEKKKHDDEACGEIETAHPGYLGSQDTFYVGDSCEIQSEGLKRRLSIPNFS